MQEHEMLAWEYQQNVKGQAMKSAWHVHLYEYNVSALPELTQCSIHQAPYRFIFFFSENCQWHELVIYFSVSDKSKLTQSSLREVVMYGVRRVQCKTRNQAIKLKCVTAWGCQADHLKPCVSWWQRPPIVLGFDLGPDECFPCGADVDTRSPMLSRTKHNRDSEVRKK